MTELPGHSGPRSRSRAWARELYDAYPDIQGLHYGSSMNGHAPAVAVALTERGQRAMPQLPQFHRALNDDMLVEALQHIALEAEVQRASVSSRTRPKASHE